jgi:hypothetical protein
MVKSTIAAMSTTIGNMMLKTTDDVFANVFFTIVYEVACAHKIE